QRVEDVLDRDRRLLLEAFAELLAREHLLRGEAGRETDDVAEPELSEPLALHDDADALARHDLVELIEVGLRVLEHLLVGHGRASIVAVGRVADLRRPVADDDHDLVPPLREALELPQGHGVTALRSLPWSNRALENDAGPCVPARGISLEAAPGRRLVQRFAPRTAVGPARHDPRDGRASRRGGRRGARLLHRGPALATGS